MESVKTNIWANLKMETNIRVHCAITCRTIITNWTHSTPGSPFCIFGIGVCKIYYIWKNQKKIFFTLLIWTTFLESLGFCENASRWCCLLKPGAEWVKAREHGVYLIWLWAQKHGVRMAAGSIELKSSKLPFLTWVADRPHPQTHRAVCSCNQQYVWIPRMGKKDAWLSSLKLPGLNFTKDLHEVPQIINAAQLRLKGMCMLSS
jgi:hypothetical protein